MLVEKSSQILFNISNDEIQAPVTNFCFVSFKNKNPIKISLVTYTAMFLVERYISDSLRY